jgi:hypothetical protein
VANARAANPNIKIVLGKLLPKENPGSTLASEITQYNTDLPAIALQLSTSSSPVVVAERERRGQDRGRLRGYFVLATAERLDLLVGGAQDLPERQRTMRGRPLTLQAIAGPVDHGLLQLLEVDGEPRLLLRGTVRDSGLELLRSHGELGKRPTPTPLLRGPGR